MNSGSIGRAKSVNSPLCLTPRYSRQGLQAMGLAGERRGERFDVEEVAALELWPFAPTTLTARRLLLRGLGKSEKGRAAVEVLDAEEWLIIERGQLEGEAADH